MVEAKENITKGLQQQLQTRIKNYLDPNCQESKVIQQYFVEYANVLSQELNCHQDNAKKLRELQKVDSVVYRLWLKVGGNRCRPEDFANTLEELDQLAPSPLLRVAKCLLVALAGAVFGAVVGAVTLGPVGMAAGMVIGAKMAAATLLASAASSSICLTTILGVKSGFFKPAILRAADRLVDQTAVVVDKQRSEFPA